jgi:hypothetical protein
VQGRFPKIARSSVTLAYRDLLHLNLNRSNRETDPNQPSQTSRLRTGLKNQPRPLKTVNEQAELHPSAVFDRFRQQGAAAPPAVCKALEELEHRENAHDLRRAVQTCF